MKTRLDQLTDQQLLANVKHLVRREREATAALVAQLAEVSRRKLYLAEGASSMFKYCTRVLHLSEHAAYLRLVAASMSERFPAILEALEIGDVSLSAIKLLAPELTPQNCDELIAAARHRSKSEIEILLARRRPRPEVPDSIRRLPASKAVFRLAEGLARDSGPVSEAAPAPAPALDKATTAALATSQAPVHHMPRSTPATRASIAPLAPERFKVQFTVTSEQRARLQRAQDLLRHRVPDGDLATIVDLALRMLIERAEARRLAQTSAPRAGKPAAPGGRTIPAAVKREVWARDEGKCAYVATNGQRCGETGWIEFHHVVPFTRGGEATVANIALRCRAHNQFEALVEGLVREMPVVWN
jgi:hypothetical protein